MKSAGPLSPQRVAVLLTGMSGAGKSTVLDELARRGHRVIDTDDPGWIVETRTADGSEPLWDLERVRALLDEHQSGWLFVAGCVAEQGALYDRFDKVVLLSAPVDVLLARVARRDNPSGSTAEDRTKIASDLAAFEPVLRTGADHEIVTTAPIPVVVSKVEKLAAAVCRPRGGVHTPALALRRTLSDRANRNSDRAGNDVEVDRSDVPF